MHCTRKVLDDLIWVGADDRRLSCFEGVYSVPEGVSYNSYLMLDETRSTRLSIRPSLKTSSLRSEGGSWTIWSFPTWSRTTPIRSAI